MIFSRVFRPWSWLPAPIAHQLLPYGVELAAELVGEDTHSPVRPITFRGLYFPNPIGIAGGVDKNAESIEAWWKLGTGFIEIGTVTPRPQLPNPGIVLMRDWKQEALWNRMGFPSQGIDHIVANLRELPPTRPTPVFLNIGRNRTTPNELAYRDYVQCIEKAGSLVDGYVINISSPNTAGLREILQPQQLAPFLTQLVKARNQACPRSSLLLLKLSPDVSSVELNSALDCALDLGIDGFVASNTTTDRTGAQGFPNEGGLSGRPLSQKSIRMLELLSTRLQQEKTKRLLISVGGILSVEDVQQRLSMGADLVQVYTALVLSGPRFIQKTLAALPSCLISKCQIKSRDVE